MKSTVRKFVTLLFPVLVFCSSGATVLAIDSSNYSLDSFTIGGYGNDGSQSDDYSVTPHLNLLSVIVTDEGAVVDDDGSNGSGNGGGGLDYEPPEGEDNNGEEEPTVNPPNNGNEGSGEKPPAISRPDDTKNPVNYMALFIVGLILLLSLGVLIVLLTRRRDQEDG